ncbi:MAG: S8 family serine peptidase, partial [Chloroflexota bacterium]
MGSYQSARAVGPILLSIIGLVILGFSVTRAAFSAEQAQIDQTFQSIEVSLSERESGEIGVIVQLNLPRAYQQEAVLGTSNLIYAQRSSIHVAQDTFINQLPAEGLTPYARFETIPFVALKVNRAGLDFLKQSPQVAHIQEDIKFTLSLASSIPVIGATEAWDRGYRGDGQAVVIIDSGLDATHSFFEGRVVAEACFSNGENEGFTLCPNGEKSQTGSGAASPLTDECIYSGTNLCIHGTHVGGIAAGDGDSESGVAPDADVIGIQVFTRIEAQECILSTLLPTCISSNFTDILLALEHIY